MKTGLIKTYNALFFVLIIGTFSASAEDQQRIITPPKAKTKLTTYLLDACPINPSSGKAFDAGSVAAAALIKWGVNKLVDIFGNALDKAAKKDRDGVVVKGSNPGFLYEFSKDDKDRPEVLPLKCVVIALSKSNIDKWFEERTHMDEEFPPHFEGSTSVHMPKYSALLADRFSGEFNAKKEFIENHDKPTFYAEIELIGTTDKKGFFPQLRTLYYPEKIPGGIKKSKPRDLFISVRAEDTSGKPAVGTFAIHIKKIEPSKTIYKRTDNKTLAMVGLDMGDITEWTPVFEMTDIKSLIESNKGKDVIKSLVFPVNIKTEIRELSKPNKFLQWFAKYFSENKDRLKKK